MPKITHKYNSEAEIPAEYKPYAKADNTVEIWINKDDLEVAKEVSPALEQKNRDVIGEKQAWKDKYEALQKVSTDEGIKAADLLAENTRLKNSTIQPEDAELLQSVKQLLPNKTTTEIKTELPKMVEALPKVAQYERNERLTSVYAASGFKNRSVFDDLMNNPNKVGDLVGEPFIESVKEGDNTINKAYVNVRDANGVTQKQEFGAWAKANPGWQPYIGALTQGADDPNKDWIVQNGSDGDGNTSNINPALAAHMKAQQEKATAAQNPFVKQAPVANTGQKTN